MFWSLSTLLLLTGGLLLSPLPLSRAEEFYVTPTGPHDPACPSGKPCHTLNDYAKNSTSLLCERDNVSLLFLDGMHILTGQNLDISDTMNLTLAGVNTSYNIDSPNAKIQLSYKWNVSIGRVMILRMEHLLIINSDYIPNYPPDILPGNVPVIGVMDISQLVHYHLAIVNCSIVIVHDQSTEILMYNSTYLESSLQVYNGNNGELQGSKNHFNITIKGCKMTNLTFSMNFGNENNLTSYYYQEIDCIGHLIVFTEKNFTTVHIHTCNMKGVTPSTNLEQSDSLNKVVEIFVENSKIQDGYFFNFSIPQKRIDVNILNCTISNSVGELIFITHFVVQESYLVESVFDLTFYTEEAIPAGDFNNTNFLMRNVTFNETNLLITGPAKVTIDRCLFENNHDGDAIFSPFFLYSINLFLVGDILFVNNVGYRGGAMYLYHSILYLEQGANVTFVNNTAEDVGGAIYVSEDDETLWCSIQLTYDVSQTEPLTSSLHFVNNSAQNGGVNIYGTSLKSDCQVTPDGLTSSYEIQSRLFQFDNESSSGLSPVSSDPKRVCLCENGEPQCADYSYIVQEKSYTSGEKFTVSLVVVGDDFGTVTGGVHAIVKSPSSHSNNSSLAPGQELQQLNYGVCSVLEYSIHSRSNEVLQLFLVVDSITIFEQFFDSVNLSIHSYQTTGEIDYSLTWTPIVLKIAILQCPLGFTLRLVGELPTCECRKLEYWLTRKLIIVL